MRLIDVEKLEEYKADCCVSLTQWQEGWNDAIDTIMNETPTVKAIPIEWIKKWSMQNQSMNYGNGRNAIIKLFNDWEKENEK